MQHSITVTRMTKIIAKVKLYIQRKNKVSIKDGCVLRGNHVMVPAVGYKSDGPGGAPHRISFNSYLERKV